VRRFEVGLSIVRHRRQWGAASRVDAGEPGRTRPLGSPRTGPSVRARPARRTATSRPYVVRRLPVSPEDAPDLTAEVCASVWRRLEKPPLSPEDRRWISGVPRRVLSRHQRGTGRRAGLLLRLASEAERAAAVESPSERTMADAAACPTSDRASATARSRRPRLVRCRPIRRRPSTAPATPSDPARSPPSPTGEVAPVASLSDLGCTGAVLVPGQSATTTPSCLGPGTARTPAPTTGECEHRHNRHAPLARRSAEELQEAYPGAGAQDRPPVDAGREERHGAGGGDVDQH